MTDSTAYAPPHSPPLVLRPCRLADLGAVERIAAASGIGIGSLPPDREKLYDKIRASSHAFSAEVDVAGEEIYFFVLEEPASGRIVGTSGIAASAGFGDRFYSYRNEFIVHASQELGASNKIHALHLCHDLTGASLLTSFYIEPAYEAGIWPHLLSRARLLFMAEHPQRFSERLAAEFPGVCDDSGHSPFWDAVGRRFFNLDYPQAEQLAGGRSKSFIAELMPQYPVYVPLLPPQAQLAIGQLHPAGELPFQLLIDEGFEAETYIDVFDGGPVVEARLASLATMRHNRRCRVQRAAGAASLAGQTMLYLVANTSAQQFRATIAALPAGADGDRGEDLLLSAGLLDLLEVANGDDLRWVPLANPEA
jgi:arginine N-succinyltransferase